MLIWIQKHDYSYEESKVEAAEEAIDVFEGFDWAGEILKMKELEGEDCPPGFGVVSEDGFILHLVPDKDGECLLHFHYPEKKRFLLLFSGTVRSSISRDKLSWSDSVAFLEGMFQGHPSELKSRLEEPGMGA